MPVIEVTEATFQQEVVERSRTTPVVIDFWAEWCGPCRQLTPLLEKMAERAGEEIVLAKIDTEANPNLSQAFAIQSIPAVKALVDGKVVDEFVGALPPAQIERFFAKLVPSEADRAMAGSPDEAALRRALELEPGRADASLALARLLAERGESEEAIGLLGRVRGSFQADGLAARLRLADDADLAPAFADLDAGRTEPGLDALLAAIPAANGQRDELRAIVVGVLDELGPGDPLAREIRRKLAAALF